MIKNIFTLRRKHFLGDSRGATVIEYVIGFVFAAAFLGPLLLLLASGLSPMFAGTVRENATTQARTWIRDMYPEAHDVAVSCQGVDTDRNGYVSCTIRVATQAPTQIECGKYIWFDWNRGCRVPRYTVPVTDND